MIIKHTGKEISCLGQISQLKREVNNEINREMKEGLIEFIPKHQGLNTTTNRKTHKALTTVS